MCGQLVGMGARRSQIVLDRRSCQTIARPHGAPGRAVPRQHGLTLVGEPDRVEARVARFGQRRTGGGEHAVPELLRVELDTAVGAGNDVDRHLGKRHHLAVGEHDRLRGRRPLINGEHGHQKILSCRSVGRPAD